MAPFQERDETVTLFKTVDTIQSAAFGQGQGEG